MPGQIPPTLGDTPQSELASVAGASQPGGSEPFLGTIAVAAARMGQEAASRLEKWHLQSVARFLLPSERIRGCCLHRIPLRTTVDVYFTPSKGSAHYGGLITCGSVWNCPVCSARISERRRELLTRAIAAWQERGGVVALVTFTFSHRFSERLRPLLSRFLAAQRLMTSHRTYKALLDRLGVPGTIRALEVTLGDHNGWHPHAHTLFFLPPGVDLALFEEELFALWSAAAKRQGLTMSRDRGLKVQATYDQVADYVAKWGHQPSRRLWGPEDELTKAHSKRSYGGRSPFDLLRALDETGESRFAAAFREYAEAFKRRRQLTWSPGLAALLGVDDDASKTDEELVEEVREDAVLLARIGWEGWRAVRLLDRRGELLEVARSGDALQLGAFVRELVAELDQRERRYLAHLAGRPSRQRGTG